MKHIKLTVLFSLILLLSTLSFGQEWIDSLDYRNFSSQPQTLLELGWISKALIAGEYHFLDKQKLREENEQLFLKNAVSQAETIEWMEKFKLQKQITEEVKPTFWQSDYMIIAYIVIAGAAGIFIGAQF